MANVLVDTRKMHEAGNDIIRLTSELNEAINMLYSRISSVTNSGGGWSGNSALEFVRRANAEKVQYIRLKDQLLSCGKILVNSADRYENSARNNRI